MRADPRVTCNVCGASLVVNPDGRGHPPSIARRKLMKQCGHREQDIYYTAGFTFGGRPRGQTEKGDSL